MDRLLVHSSKNFQMLTFPSRAILTCYEDYRYENAPHIMLAQFPLLKKLIIESYVLRNYSELPLTNAIANSNPLIEELEFGVGFPINSAIIRSISNLKFRRVFRSVYAQILQRDLILLATELPLLTEIDIKHYRSLSITIDGFKNILQSGKQMKRIKLVGVRDLHINHNE